MKSLPIINHSQFKVSKDELAEPLIQLFLARKNEKFKGMFKTVRNGKIVNYIKENQEDKYPSMYYDSHSHVSSSVSPPHINTSEVVGLSPHFGIRKFVKPQEKTMIKK
jgi:hypothetical protein